MFSKITQSSKYLSANRPQEIAPENQIKYVTVNRTEQQQKNDLEKTQSTILSQLNSILRSRVEKNMMTQNDFNSQDIIKIKNDLIKEVKFFETYSHNPNINGLKEVLYFVTQIENDDKITNQTHEVQSEHNAEYDIIPTAEQLSKISQGLKEHCFKNKIFDIKKIKSIPEKPIDDNYEIISNVKQKVAIIEEKITFDTQQKRKEAYQISNNNLKPKDINNAVASEGMFGTELTEIRKR